MNVSTYGASPYGGGSGFPTMEEIRSAAAEAGRNAVRHLGDGMFRRSFMTATEVAAMRGLARNIARSAVRLHPWVRAADLALQGYEAAQAAGIPMPEFAIGELNLPDWQVPEDMRVWELPGLYRDMFAMLSPWRMTKVVPNTAWQMNPNAREGGGYADKGTFAPVSPTTTRSMSSYRRIDYASLIGAVGVGGGYAWYAVGSWSTGVSSKWLYENQIWYAACSLPAGLYAPTAAGIPPLTTTITRTLYPAAAMPIPQVMPLPHAKVGQVNRWRELIRPREDGRPIRDNGTVALPISRPVFPSIGIGVGGKVDLADPHKFAPPKKGEKEKKAVARGKGVNAIFAALNKMRRIGNDATEAVDFVTAIYYALPKQYQDAGRRPSVLGMLQSLSDHWEHIDAGLAVINLGIASAADYAVGKSTEGVRQNFLKYRGDTPLNRERPWFYGPLL